MGQAMAYIAAVFAKMEAQRISERKLAANKELRTTDRFVANELTDNPNTPSPYGGPKTNRPSGLLVDKYVCLNRRHGCSSPVKTTLQS